MIEEDRSQEDPVQMVLNHHLDNNGSDMKEEDDESHDFLGWLQNFKKFKCDLQSSQFIFAKVLEFIANSTGSATTSVNQSLSGASSAAPGSATLVPTTSTCNNNNNLAASSTQSQSASALSASTFLDFDTEWSLIWELLMSWDSNRSEAFKSSYAISLHNSNASLIAAMSAPNSTRLSPLQHPISSRTVLHPVSGNTSPVSLPQQGNIRNYRSPSLSHSNGNNDTSSTVKQQQMPISNPPISSSILLYNNPRAISAKLLFHMSCILLLSHQPNSINFMHTLDQSTSKNNLKNLEWHLEQVFGLHWGNNLSSCEGGIVLDLVIRLVG
ncbi:unnamed protein product [Ambrosiozyma monospora]|uniref:Unnamed protein product n=1 Tax=Ambrosiozyma monospora TaxID=43982 RepID=A0ACB5TU84_AMBMO|nr:unnamed protein product [Ambrosiozyma monospora]